jgi:hypothetical protein
MRSRIPLFSREEVFDQSPLLVREFVPTHRWASLPSCPIGTCHASVYPIWAESAKMNVNTT